MLLVGVGAGVVVFGAVVLRVLVCGFWVLGVLGRFGLVGICLGVGLDVVGFGLVVERLEGLVRFGLGVRFAVGVVGGVVGGFGVLVVCGVLFVVVLGVFVVWEFSDWVDAAWCWAVGRSGRVLRWVLGVSSLGGGFVGVVGVLGDFDGFGGEVRVRVGGVVVVVGHG